MDQPERRAEINQAWVEGRQAGRDGQDRLANPYAGDRPKAHAWDEGWSEGNAL